MPKGTTMLVIIRLIHTIIWLIIVIAILFTLYAGLLGINNLYLAFALGLIGLEIGALVLNNWECPLTTLAKKYLDQYEIGSDIYLPRFIAKYNRQIFTPPLVLALILVTVRLLA
jgi:hypothetical protein